MLVIQCGLSSGPGYYVYKIILLFDDSVGVEATALGNADVLSYVFLLRNHYQECTKRLHLLD
jgi:hypothetical protein